MTVSMPAGSRFGAWTLIGPAPKISRDLRFFCRCACGQEASVIGADLRSGKSTKCRECQLRCFQQGKVTHGATRGLSRPPEYRTWANMRGRCHNPKSPRFKDYGERGVSICERWHDFEAFFADMGPRPSSLHSIERENNNGNYEPDNCVWALPQKQNRNQRSNIIVNYQGQSVTLAEAVETANANGYPILYHSAYSRIARGWSTVDALERPKFYRPSK
jgi:hypothetical protein